MLINLTPVVNSQNSRRTANYTKLVYLMKLGFQTTFPHVIDVDALKCSLNRTYVCAVSENISVLINLTTVVNSQNSRRTSNYTKLVYLIKLGF